MVTPARLSDLKVLVVDDSTPMLMLTRALLEKGGAADVREASSGREALTLLSDWLPDIALIDHQMPEMQGFDLIRHIRASPRDELMRLPIILVTGASEAEIAGVMYSAGADDWLFKPFDAEILYARIDRCLDAVNG